MNGPAIGALLVAVLGYFIWRYQRRPAKVAQPVDLATESFLAALRDDTKDDLKLVTARQYFGPAKKIRKRIRE